MGEISEGEEASDVFVARQLSKISRNKKEISFFSFSFLSNSNFKISHLN